MVGRGGVVVLVAVGGGGLTGVVGLMVVTGLMVAAVTGLMEAVVAVP
jgi:hypothetical protein